MGGNHFYSNAEAYAYEILQQKLIKEAQRAAQQTVMELSAFKSLFNQGQFIYCIPFGGSGVLGQNLPVSSCIPFPNMSPVEPNFMPSNPYYLPYHPPPPPQPPPPPPQPLSSQNTSPCTAGNSLPPGHNLLQSQSPIHNNKNSVVHVSVKNHPKLMVPKAGSDECNLGKEGIEVTIDLREYIPAEIHINVEEKSLEIKACHVSEVGSKTFARRYDLPACIILDSVKTVLSHDGYLLFSAAWVKME